MCPKRTSARHFDDLFGPGKNPVYLYDCFGSTEVDLICQRITYMAKALGIKWVILDHISILISGQAFGTNERTLIDYAMTKLRHSRAGTGHRPCWSSRISVVLTVIEAMSRTSRQA